MKTTSPKTAWTTALLLTLALAPAGCGGDGAANGSDALAGDALAADTIPADGSAADAIPGDAPPGDGSAGLDSAADTGAGPDATTADVAPDSAPDPDASGRDGTGEDVGPGPEDAGPGLDVDPGRPDGWSGDASVVGTALDDLAVRWERPLVLCSEWTENASIEAELAGKVRVTIPVHSRSGVAPEDLEGLTLDGVTIERGPLSAERHLDVDARTSTLTDYTVVEGGNYVAMSATVEHRFGVAGTLVESYSVGRGPAGQDDVVIGGDDSSSYEVAFFFVPPGGDPFEDGKRLGSCAGPPDLENAVGVLVGTNAQHAITIVRYWRTQETFAGSYPVEMDLHRVTFSDDPWTLHDARGFWAQTYSAQHHNWGEATQIDFTRDLATWQTAFRAIAAGGTPDRPLVARVVLRDVNSWDVEPRAEVIRVGTDGAEMAPETFALGDGWWRGVDTPTLEGELARTCDGAAVYTLGHDSSYLFQVLTCPRAAPPGFGVVGVVPVGFAHDMTAVGRTFDDVRESTEGDQPKFTVTVDPEGGAGASEIDVVPQPGGAFLLRVRDVQGATRQESWAEPGDLDVARAVDEHALVGVSADGSVAMRLVRRYAAWGVGESVLYAPVSFALTFDGDTHVVEAWDRLDYENTHHNWNDGLTARTDAGWTLHWRYTFHDPATEQNDVHTVWGEDAAGATVLPETVLPVMQP